jgi:hypothetical protein
MAAQKNRHRIRNVASQDGTALRYILKVTDSLNAQVKSCNKKQLNF